MCHCGTSHNLIIQWSRYALASSRNFSSRRVETSFSVSITLKEELENSSSWALRTKSADFAHKTSYKHKRKNFEQSISSLLNGSSSEGAEDATPKRSQKPNAVVFGKDSQGVASASMLREFHEEGTLLLTTLQQDGTIRTETLSRLPKDFRLTEAVVAMPSEGESQDMFRIVINVKPRLRYSIAPDEKRLPVVIERTRSSVPTFERKLKRRLGADPSEVLHILEDGRVRSEDEGD